uniref:Interphotoreceptor matrix proteoglycan 1 n=1 Tax=Astyanax mexicanus TaxID=7994 RepID=A0A3B1KKF4_ASTMX
MPLKTGLFLILFLFTLQATRIKIRNVRYRHFLGATRPVRQIPAARVSVDQSRQHREKRSALFSTGVKVCPQESMAEVISSHKAYYKLRCQEAVWEAFQIFLDRVPDTVEYQQWVYACQRDSLCVDDLARNFSSTQEHLDMAPGEKSKTPGELLKTGTAAPVPAELVEHIIEFSVTVVDPGYSDLLRDPDSLQYQDVSLNLHEQMLQIFSKLPGFKEIRLLGFSGGGTVRYAVVFELEEDTTEAALKDMVAKALSEDKALPLDLHSLSFEPRPQDHIRYLPGGIITQPTVAISEESSVATSISMSDAASNGTPGKRDEEAAEGTTQEIFKGLPPETTLAGTTERPPPDTTGHSQLEEEKLITENTQIAEPKKNTTLDYPSKPSESQNDLVNEIFFTAATPNLNSFEAVTTSVQVGSSAMPSTEVPSEVAIRGDVIGPSLEPPESNSPLDSPDVVSVSEPSETEFPLPPSTTENTQPIETPPVLATPNPVPPVDIPSVSSVLPVIPESDQPERIPDSDINMQEDVEQTEEETDTSDNQDYGGGFEADEHPQSSAPDIAASHARDLVVFFSLRVTNMVFSEDLFNKSSPEYKSLENTFLELQLLPYLQSNLTGFKELQILNFRNGSVVVNSKMKLAKPVPYNVTEAVHCVLEDFCNAASKRLDIEIDPESVDVAAVNDGDPCKYLDCNEFSRCVVNTLTAEAECLCDPGYSTENGQPCESICNLQPDYCLNGGTCEILAGHGATCCPLGKFWHYHGERCNELVSVPVDPLLFVACLIGSLTVVCAVIGILVFINKKCIRTRKTVSLSPDNSTQEDQKG